MYATLLLLGSAILAPWYCVISALDFFESYYELSGAVLEQYHLPPLEYVFGLLYNVPCVALIITQLLVRASGGYSKRIVSGLVINVVAMAVMPCLKAFGLGRGPALFVVLFLVVAAGAASGILYSALFGYASLLPPICTQALMFGISVSGLVVALVRIATKAALTELPGTSGAIYFAIASFVELVAIVAYLRLRHNYRASRAPRNAVVGGPEGVHSGAASGSDAPSDASLGSASPLREGPDTWLLQSPNGTEFGKALAPHTGPAMIEAGDRDLAAAQYSPPPRARIGTVTRKVLPHGLAVFFIFFTTLALFPGVVTAITSDGDLFRKIPSWFAIVLVTTFSAGDFVGRLLPYSERATRFTSPSVRLLAATGLRAVIFFATFPLLAKGVVRSDALAGFLVAVFAISNGFLASVSMMAGGSAPCLDGHEKDLAGTLMSLFLNAGVALGSSAGWLAGYLVA